MKLTFPHAALKGLLTRAMQQWPLEIRPLYGNATGPGFWIVGDQGVYLMHNGKPHEGMGSQPVVYALECDPHTLEFDEWWENKRATFGADDGADFIEADTIRDAVENGHDLIFSFSRDQMIIESAKPKQP